jgi:Ran GTPase-activating protein (RanGAP) involved in mRNA processing and transport
MSAQEGKNFIIDKKLIDQRGVDGIISMIKDQKNTSVEIRSPTSVLSNIVSSLPKEQITDLYILHVPIGQNEAQEIAAFLESNHTLLNLCLNFNQMTSDCAEIIVKALLTESTIEMSNLKVLNLCNNELRDNGAKHIASLLDTNTSIEHLWLSANMIGDDGTEAICNSLRHNKTLQQMSLRANLITDKGAKFVGDLLLVTTTLTHLTINYNQIKEGGADHIYKCLEQNPTLTFLFLYKRHGMVTSLNQLCRRNLNNKKQQSATLFSLFNQV